jgi:hypothetical protein
VKCVRLTFLFFSLLGFEDEHRHPGSPVPVIIDPSLVVVIIVVVIMSCSSINDLSALTSGPEAIQSGTDEFGGIFQRDCLSRGGGKSRGGCFVKTKLEKAEEKEQQQHLTLIDYDCKRDGLFFENSNTDRVSKCTDFMKMICCKQYGKII